MNKEFLRRLDLFSGMKDEDLDRLDQLAQPVEVKAGQVLMKEGAPGDALYVVVDGEFEINKRRGSRDVMLTVRRAGEMIGEMSLLSQSPRQATVRALTDSHVLRVSDEAFAQVLACSPSAGMAALRMVTMRLRDQEAVLVQNEKMAALGTMAAGLAHELNNPAAAAQRSSDQLHAKLDEWWDLTTALERENLDETQRARLGELRERVDRHETRRGLLDPMARANLETELEDRLDSRGVDEAWEIAPTLAADGWRPEEMEDLAAVFRDSLGPVVRWLAAGLSTYSLLSQVKTSAERISELVKAIKTYSYLDRAPIQQVDLVEGLENTLVILGHKLKAGVEIKREYDPKLPMIEAYGSELNQVWTNLIDNAIDAMDGHGIITLRAYPKNDEVVVEIEDNGPGIPPDVQSHIFEPFFTTKGPGKGTGLGLHIAYSVVVDRHRGDIEVVSKPGSTRFLVALPVHLAHEPGEK